MLTLNISPRSHDDFDLVIDLSEGRLAFEEAEFSVSIAGKESRVLLKFIGVGVPPVVVDLGSFYAVAANSSVVRIAKENGSTRELLIGMPVIGFENTDHGILVPHHIGAAMITKDAQKISWNTLCKGVVEDFRIDGTTLYLDLDVGREALDLCTGEGVIDQPTLVSTPTIR